MTLRYRAVVALVVAAASAASAQPDAVTRAVVIPQQAAMDSAAPEPTWDMDVRSYEAQDRVAHYVSMFSGRAKERIAERLSAGSRYEPMIRASMKAGGVPEDMYYLALVESGYNPHAYSRAAAVGMWQFMTSTARDMGLRVDRWVDERRDPVRSTSAAVRFIRGLRDQFGSLYLAAAAYNGGPGRVARGLTKYADDLQGAQGEDAFFVLAGKDFLKTETRDYVPQLIAAALVGKDPVRYGMDLHARPPFAYDSVLVPPATPLSAIARAAGAAVGDVSELNPHLLRGMTPPNESFQVRIPPGTGAGFDSLFAALPRADMVATRSFASRKGDTPARLAHAHGIPESAFRTFNPGLHTLKNGRLAPGQSMVLPTVAVALAALDVPDHSLIVSTKARKGRGKGKSGASSKADARSRTMKRAAGKRKSAG
ncbi:MAG: transglycosylase SLT domain-containing protein [Polaromonas sp.]|nr:transglycosylase SLT domain-containing protein [Gemmatimonadaceae bacterium]